MLKAHVIVLLSMFFLNAQASHVSTKSVCGGGEITHEIYERSIPDSVFMKAAIDVAIKAQEHGHHPFGAILVHEGKVIARAENRANEHRLFHAEYRLVHGALENKTITKEMLKASTLYSSAEPCAMCAGAIFWAGVRTVVYSEGHETFGNDSLGRSSRSVYEHAKKSEQPGEDRRMTVIGPIADPLGRSPAHDFFTK